MASNEATSGDAQTIQELRARYDALNTRRIQVTVQLESARTQLSTLQEQAREKYGTDDIEELQAKLEEMRADNERQRAEYQASLEAIEADLLAVDGADGDNAPDAMSAQGADDEGDVPW